MHSEQPLHIEPTPSCHFGGVRKLPKPDCELKKAGIGRGFKRGLHNGRSGLDKECFSLWEQNRYRVT